MTGGRAVSSDMSGNGEQPPEVPKRRPTAREGRRAAVRGASSWLARRGRAFATPARDDKFPEEQIEGADNKVLIPTLKHRDISGWYSKRNPFFGGLSPRDYLRGKDWDTRRRIGIYALIKFGFSSREENQSLGYDRRSTRRSLRGNWDCPI